MQFAQALKREKIKNLTTRGALTASGDTSLGDLIAKMKKAKRGCAVILRKKRVVGIFTEQDALKRGMLNAADPATPIRRLMTKDPTMLQMDDSLADAIRLMHEGKYRHLPIVNPQGEFLGVVSVRDIVFYLSENYPFEVLNQPPDPHQISATAEGA